MADKQAPPTTVSQMREWLRTWVANTTGIPVEDVGEHRLLEEFGLSSRDVVVLSGDLERLTGKRLDATVAYEYNTVAALADYLITGGQGVGRSALASNPTGQTARANTARGGATDPEDRDIAIVGMAARYPGAENLQQMWDMLLGYRAGIGDLPEGRWSEYEGDEAMRRRMAQARLTGGYLPDLAGFDAEFFGLSPVEATNMDPQQRILLQLTWEALEHAHIPANTLRGRDVGVFVGTTNNDYAMLIAGDTEQAHPYALTGNSTAVVANRLSYVFDFRGPSVAMDTACSSSLVAIHHAVRSLRDADSSVAVAAGVNLLASPFATVAFSELGVLSPTGAIRAFSEDADGIVRSDGAGVVILKRLGDAKRDGDDIYAVIKGSAVNSDGRSNGLTAPNPDAQVDVLRAAYADAGVNPGTVDYVEAHGTGTILGDPIEATALGAVLGPGRTEREPTLLGSVKTNFGHTEAAAGVAGVMKVALAMREGLVPPSLNYSGPNPYIDFAGQHLEVVEDAREWPEYSGHPVAGVSGFGFGGTNAHVVIAAPDAAAPNASADTAALDSERKDAARKDRGPAFSPDSSASALLPVSGMLASRRREAAESVRDWLAQHSSADLGAVARTLAGRNHGRSRGVVLATDHDGAVEGLTRLAEGRTGEGRTGESRSGDGCTGEGRSSEGHAATPPALALAQDAPATMGPVWVFSGFGSQHPAMATELLADSPVFADSLAAMDTIVTRESGWSILEKIRAGDQRYDTESAQVGITCIQMALVDLLRHMGVTPAAVVGQSMGEIAAAYAAGGLSREDALLVACHRSRLMGELEAQTPEEKQGAMAVVELSTEQVEELTSQHKELTGVEPAVFASPGMTTVGGPRPAVSALVERVSESGSFARMLPVKGAGHTSMLDPILGELSFEIEGIEALPLRVPLYSTVDPGRVYQPGEVAHEADYFIRCTRQPVHLEQAVGQQFQEGYTTFVEFSPHPVALMPVLQVGAAHGVVEPTALHLLKRDEPDAQTVLRAVGELYVSGADVDFTAIAGAGEYAPVPGVRWRNQHFWTQARPAAHRDRGMIGSRVDLPDGRVAFSVAAQKVPSLLTLASSLAGVLAGADTAGSPVVREASGLPPAGKLSVLATPTVGGWAITVHGTAEDGAFTLAGEAFIPTPGASAQSGAPESGAVGGAVPSSIGDATSPSATATSATSPTSSGPESSAPASFAASAAAADPGRWSPESGESVGDRLRSIISESMGYDADDLPGELPLIDLGLDSLMGMRIKNRVEHAFNIPQLQVQALRDGSVDDVIRMVEQAVAEQGVSAQAAVEQPAPAPAVADQGAGGQEREVPEVASPRNETAGQQPETTAAARVAPRDASERLAFGTWAKITGSALPGVTAPLPGIDEPTAAALAERLGERSGADITAADVQRAGTLADLASLVRDSLETEVDGNIRVLRERRDGGEQRPSPAVFVFHPAGGSSAVFQPLARRLPAHVPVYGVERREGAFAERAASYVPDIQRLAAGKPVIFVGWSFGGALAMEVAHQLRALDGETPVEIQRIVLLDTVQPRHPAPDTPTEMHARWDRYAQFANRTYGLNLTVPHDLLDQQGEQVMMDMFQQMLSSPELAGGLGLPAGVLEHQRASFVDNRILEGLDFTSWEDVAAPVTLFRASKMHDGAIELEPAYRDVAEDGGWSAIVEDLEIIHLDGDHLAIVDEPDIGTIGDVITRHIQAGS
ncbi:polyketide synthase Pks13 [Corynebacterium heidelbergense]|uniref:Polyketide synthase n=1 Tax=Corynebacterium heidelbergense TaxID=2055947 RepID=A0A364V7B2_9CORY|nr:polyketide synthase Pks13 [Corynebacterium heidelbergense]RAV32494.1 polyketide synthase [Corynebacterium heidelbergense]